MQFISNFLGLRSCGYSVVHRLIEVAAIATVGVCGLALLWRMGAGFTALPWSTTAWAFTLAILLGYLMADFASGFVHWMGDTFGDEHTPVLGMSFVKPFRHHHVDPYDITRHDFIEVNGNNSIVLLMVLLPAVLFLPEPDSALTFFLMALTTSFVFGIFMTNQFHKWSHMAERPRWMKVLQDAGVILSPEHHDVHHTAPFDTYYCITCGWMNPILQKLQFFERAERLVRGVLRMPKPGVSE
jgi:plasmanylethanolamine desaturase